MRGQLSFAAWNTISLRHKRKFWMQACRHDWRNALPSENNPPFVPRFNVLTLLTFQRPPENSHSETEFPRGRYPGVASTAAHQAALA
jgi:hypothetical protein